MERVPLAKTTDSKGNVATGFPRRSVSQFEGWSTVGEVRREQRRAKERQLEQKPELERGFSAGFDFNTASSSEMMSEFEEASESNNIISLGSPPGEDALEWAQTSEESAEDMPISFKVRSICELVQLALERDFASDVRWPLPHPPSTPIGFHSHPTPRSSPSTGLPAGYVPGRQRR